MKNFILIGLILITGCAVPLLTEKTVVSDIAVGNSTVRGNVKSEYRVLWDLCMNKLEAAEAEEINVNESKGVIETHIANISLKIKIDSIDFQTQRLKISASKHLLPKPEFAQKIFFEIVDEFE
jgi:hypothetical protein